METKKNKIISKAQPKQISQKNDNIINIFSPLKDARLFHPSTLPKVEKLVGNRIIDLILYTPCNYELYKQVDSLLEIENNTTCCVELTIISLDKQTIPLYIMAKRHIPFKIKCITKDKQIITLVFFNFFPKMMENFFIGRKMICQGKLSIDNKGNYSIIHPHISSRIQDFQGIKTVYKLSQIEDYDIDISNMQFDAIAPIYRLTDGLKQMQLVNAIERILKKNTLLDFSVLDSCDEIINHHYLNPDNVSILPKFHEAIYKLHFPKNINDILGNSVYRKKLAFLELLSFQFALAKVRSNRITENGTAISGNYALREKVISSLPFNLTEDQKKCLEEIYKDQSKDKKMLRLLQGDVGSGKTIVALLACLNAVEAGKKAVIMAPTAILAKQHFTKIQQICSGLGLQIELFIGETKQKARNDILTRLSLGMIDILVGTHTLFQKSINLPKNIGLFVIDEQHNFGVEQRIKLLEKCKDADTLMMSATPIPRTMIMTLYGDIQVSRISQKPSNRLPIETKILSFEEKYEQLVQAIKRKVDADEKIYWVCPLVEESEKLEYTDVQTRFKELSNIIGKDKIAILHGKMKQEDKDKAMLEFKNGNINLLVSTTVIEVGIDVPDATIIVIENAEKFGLAQLHQLRGRVGRGNKQSYCFLLYGNKISDIGKQRLEILKKYSDGFLIAEADLKIRGGGAILSSKQSGFNTMKFVNFVNDKDIINIINSSHISQIDNNKIAPILKCFNYEKDGYEKFGNG